MANTASRLRLFPAVLGLLSFSATLLGQYGTGVVLGTVTDPSKAVIPGVQVTGKNQATGETRTFTTDSLGNYQLNALLAGTYTVTAQAQGFKTATIEGVVVSVNSQTRVDMVMELGSVNETIQVLATVPLLQTNTALLGTVVDTRTVLELPLNARNFFDLVALTPGALKAASGSSVMDNRGITIGGTRVNNSTYAQLDGVDFTVENVHNPAIALSLDDIDEFKVQENFMDASYGHGAADIDIVSKSGTNQFHGVLYDFVRNRSFQAGQFFRPRTGAPRFTYNQFGGGAGGAIRKNKLFYYGNYEGRRRRTGIILQGLVPTLQMQQGDFSQLGKTVADPLSSKAPFAGNMIPKSRFDPIAVKMLQFFPAPNLAGRPGVNYLVTPSDRERRDQFTGRIDYKVSDKGNLFGRYSFADDALVNVAYRVGDGLIRPDRTQHVAVGYTYVFSPTLISETRLGFTKAFLARQGDGNLASKNYAAELGFQNLGAQPGDYTEPNLSLSGYAPGFPSNTGGFAGYGTHIVQNNLYYRISENLTLIRGNHSIKIGGDADRLMVGYDQGSSQNGLLNFAGTFTGDSFGDYLLGFPISATGGLGSLNNSLGGVAKYSIGSLFQGYVQDDWKVTERLTLNLGLRYELFLPWRGRMANFDLGTGRQLLAGSPDYYVPGQGIIHGSGGALLPERPIKTDWNNFAPRLGMAYRVGGKTVVRAGAGVFYSLNVGGNTINRMLSTPPFFVFANLVSSSLTPQIVMSQLFPPAAAATTAVTGNVDLNKRYGYMYQYNLNVQHQLRPSLLLEAGFIGNTAQKQENPVFVNQPQLPADPAHPTPFAARMPYPSLVPGFTQTANYQWSNYNAGYVKVVQRAARGLTYTAAYTYSKLLESGGYGSAGQNMYNRRPERGLADDHVPQNFVGSWVYDLPVGRGRAMEIQNRFLDGVIGGWEMTGIVTFQAGRYYTIGTAGDIANVGTGGQRANATGVPAKKLDPRTNGLLGLDKAAFATPVAGTFGNAARNLQPGFGINQWDAGLYKNFAVRWLGEAGRLQVRSEWFNIFNHTQFNNPISTVNTSTFGLVNSTLDPRILQLAAKLYW
ncbi:MAG TPA: TonB-dependent receptor [Terriglobales bacterium]|nr:TonB-dependent receptor [Terriglobales bacterium]